MALLKQQPLDDMVEDFIADADDENIGAFETIYRMMSKFALGGVIKGFMSGIGVFIGSILCHYYILPHLNLQHYSLFLIKLHKIE